MDGNPLLCPLTGQMFVEPVVLLSSGRTYERQAIEEWIMTGHRTDPITGEPLKSFAMRPNVLAKELQNGLMSLVLTKGELSEEMVRSTVSGVSRRLELQNEEERENLRKSVLESLMRNAVESKRVKPSERNEGKKEK